MAPFKGFITRNTEDTGNFYGTLPPIDKKKVLSVYVRQSSSGADDAHGENRGTQLNLVKYAKKLLGVNEEERYAGAFVR